MGERGSQKPKASKESARAKRREMEGWGRGGGGGKFKPKKHTCWKGPWNTHYYKKSLTITRSMTDEKYLKISYK